MRIKDKNLLAEAYRRYNEFHRDMNSIGTAWLGLGFPSHYESEYFKPVGPEIPRCLSWYTLTKKGVEIVNELLGLNSWEDDTNHDLFCSPCAGSHLTFP